MSLLVVIVQTKQYVSSWGLGSLRIGEDRMPGQAEDEEDTGSRRRAAAELQSTAKR